MSISERDNFIYQLLSENRRLLERVKELENNYNITSVARTTIDVDDDNASYISCLDNSLHKPSDIKPEIKKKTYSCHAQCGLTKEDVNALLKELCDVDDKLKVFRKVIYSVASDSGVIIGKNYEFKTPRGFAYANMPAILERVYSQYPDIFHKCEILGAGSRRPHSLKRSEQRGEE